MDKMKQWVALAVVGALAILAGGWFLVVSPKRADAQTLRDEASAQERANAMLVTQLTELKAQAKDLPAQQAKLAAVAAKVPGNSAMPALIRALNDAAQDTGVELVSLSPSAPADVVAPVAAATTPTAAAPAKTGTTSGTSAASSAAGAAVVGTLQQIGVTLNVVGSYFQVAEYLDRLENLTRAFRVTGFNLAPGLNPVKKAESQPKVDTGKVLTAAINGLVFQTRGAATASLTTAK